MLKFKRSCAVLAYLSSNLLNEVGLSYFRYFEVGLRVCDVVVKKFTSAISSPDEFLLTDGIETFHEVSCTRIRDSLVLTSRNNFRPIGPSYAEPSHPSFTHFTLHFLSLSRLFSWFACACMYKAGSLSYCLMGLIRLPSPLFISIILQIFARHDLQRHKTTAHMCTLTSFALSTTSFAQTCQFSRRLLKL